MVAGALPSLLDLKQTIGPGASTWYFRRWWLFGGIAVIGVAAGLFAYLPARKASRLNPIEALRHE